MANRDSSTNVRSSIGDVLRSAAARSATTPEPIPTPTPPPQVQPQFDENGVRLLPSDLNGLGSAVDEVFVDSEAPGSAPAVLLAEPTPESQRAVLAETKARRGAIAKGYRKAQSLAMRERDPNKRVEKVKRADDYQSQLMVMNCAKPLTQNVGPSELLEAATTMAVLWALSPKVRKTLDGYADKVHDALRYNRSDLKARMNEGSFAQTPEQKAIAAKQAEAADRELLATTENAMTSDRPISGLDSAAEKIMGFDEGLYRNMRAGMGVDEARAIYSGALDEAKAQWSADGLDFAAVKATVRSKIAAEAAEDPEAMARYVNTYSGEVTPGARFKNGDWGNRWFSPKLGYLDESKLNLFSVRAPMDPDQYVLAMADVAAADYAMAARRGPDAVAQVLRGYEAGVDLVDYKLDEGVLGGPSMAEQNKLGVERFRTMAAAMADDGIHPDLRMACLSSGAARGWAEFESAHPEQAAAFAAKYPDGVGKQETAGLVESLKSDAVHRRITPLFSPEAVVNPRLAAWEKAKTEQGITLPSPVAETGREQVVVPERGEDVPGFDLPTHPLKEKTTQAAEVVSDKPVISKVQRAAQRLQFGEVDAAPVKKSVIPRSDTAARTEPVRTRTPNKSTRPGSSGPER